MMKDKFRKFLIGAAVGIPVLYVSGIVMATIFPAGIMSTTINMIISLAVASGSVTATNILIFDKN